MAWYDRPKMRNHPDVETYLDGLPPATRALCTAVRDAVKEDAEVVEFIAWSVPMYWRVGPICYTSAAKGHVTLGFMRGIEFCDDRLSGTGKSPVARMVLPAAKPFPAHDVEALIAKAIELDRLDQD